MRSRVSVSKGVRVRAVRAHRGWANQRGRDFEIWVRIGVSPLDGEVLVATVWRPRAPLVLARAEEGSLGNVDILSITS